MGDIGNIPPPQKVVLVFIRFFFFFFCFTSLRKNKQMDDKGKDVTVKEEATPILYRCVTLNKVHGWRRLMKNKLMIAKANGGNKVAKRIHLEDMTKEITQ